MKTEFFYWYYKLNLTFWLACYYRHWLYSWPEVPLIISLTCLAIIYFLLACCSLLSCIFSFHMLLHYMHVHLPLFILPLTRSLIDDPEFAMLRSRSEHIAGSGVLWARCRSSVDHPQFSSWGLLVFLLLFLFVSWNPRHTKTEKKILTV